MFEDSFIHPGKVFIPDNAMLHCYTDGITDVENDSGSDFGMDRLREFLTARMNTRILKSYMDNLFPPFAFQTVVITRMILHQRYLKPGNFFSVHRDPS